MKLGKIKALGHNIAAFLGSGIGQCLDVVRVIRLQLSLYFLKGVNYEAWNDYLREMTY